MERLIRKPMPMAVDFRRIERVKEPFPCPSVLNPWPKVAHDYRGPLADPRARCRWLLMISKRRSSGIAFMASLAFHY